MICDCVLRQKKAKHTGLIPLLIYSPPKKEKMSLDTILGLSIKLLMVGFMVLILYVTRRQDLLKTATEKKYISESDDDYFYMN